MPRRLPVRRALVAGLAATMLATAAAPALAATAAELQRARERVDRTSAELAAARTAAENLGGDERDRLERLQRRLERQKAELVDLESEAEERHADAVAAREDAAPPGAEPSSAGDGPVVVLADPPADAASPAAGAPTAAAPASANAVVPLPDERRPAVAGDDAAVAARIDGYLASRASPLTGLGAVFVTEGRAAGVDPLFIVAISGAETSFGTYGPSQAIHNPFGMGPGIVYPSWSDAIRAAARNLGGRLYAGSGLVTIPAIQARWAPHGATNDPSGLNSNWTRNVSTYLAELGGDPAGVVVHGTAAAPAAPAAPSTAAVAATGTPTTGPGGVPVVTPTAPTVLPSVTLGSSGQGPAAAQSALSQLGAPSVRGGEGPARGFDAAGLVRWAYREHAVTLPRSVVAQSRLGTAVEPTELKPGDAIFFSDPSGLVEHVGLYLGDGQFVHAAGPGDEVVIASLYEPHNAEAYAGARRY